jgi:RNA-directed DNA polymerase
MTETKSTGAPETLLWSYIDWDKIQCHVNRLQKRIAKAVKDKKWNKVRALQYLLSKSFYAKLLAVRRVTSSKGSKTGGVDNETWETDEEKSLGLQSLRNRGYKPKPLRRIYIPKQNGKKRPLSIPTMKDRAMQALQLLALEPISESLSDKTSYGFRPKRSAHDAIAYCRLCLGKSDRSKWVLDADIEGCFDNIDHQWLLKNIPMNKSILEKWLKSGFIFKERYYDTDKGTPQGGIISPILANMVLDGLSEALAKVNKSDKVNLIRYADDMLITGISKQTLVDKVLPIVEAFLSERGLRLSQEKTKIVHINDGFNFLGFNIRKYKNKLLIKPSKGSINKIVRSIKDQCKAMQNNTQQELIAKLNPKILGWGSYYKHANSKRIFSKVEHLIFWRVFRWAKRKHSTKSWTWVKAKYFKTTNSSNWIFSPKSSNIKLENMSKIKVYSHILIKHEANIYDSDYDDYFVWREKFLKTRAGLCLTA